MTRRLRGAAVAGLVLVAGSELAGGAPAAPPAATAVRAEPAARLVDSIGVVTHATYDDTAYGRWDRVVAALGRLGVRHVRDGLFASTEPALRAATERDHRAVRAAAARGVRFDFLVSPAAQGGSVAQQLGLLTGPLRGTAASVEGPNEPDAAGGTAWIPGTRAVQEQLHREAKAVPALRGLPVLGPSLVQDASRTALGDLTAFTDAGSIHPYTGARPPSAAALAAQAAMARRVSGDQPLYATEAGFHTALLATAGQPPTSERAAAGYTLRTVLEHFRAGIVRTFLYELVDEKPDPGLTDAEQHFGLLRNDFSEKPAFTALANLIASLGGPSGERGGAGATRVTVRGAGTAVRHLLLRRGPRRYSLVLWPTASTWDPERRVDLPVAPRTVRVTAPGIQDAALVRPVEDRRERPAAVASGTASVRVGGDPVILSWSAAAPAGGGRPGLLAVAALAAAALLALSLRARRRRAAPDAQT